MTYHNCPWHQTSYNTKAKKKSDSPLLHLFKQFPHIWYFSVWNFSTHEKTWHLSFLIYLRIILTILKSRPHFLCSYLPAKKLGKLQPVYAVWDRKLAFNSISIWAPPFCFARKTIMSRNAPNQKIKIKSCPHISISFFFFFKVHGIEPGDLSKIADWMQSVKFKLGLHLLIMHVCWNILDKYRNIYFAK